MTDTLRYLRYRLRHSLPKDKAQRLFLTVLLVLALPVGVVLVRQVQRYRAGAALDTAKLYFEPAQQSLPPDSNFKIMLDSKTNQVGFVRVEFTFDPSKVQFSNEITITPRLSTIIQKTTMAQANAAGQAIIVAALSPGDRGNPLVGINEIANVNMHTVAVETNLPAMLSITDAGVQLIDLLSNSVPFTSEQSSLVLNPVSATSTTAPIATSTIAETSTPIPTATLTAAPSPTSTHTPTPTGTSTPTHTPTPIAATVTTAPIATNTSVPTATSAPKQGDANGDGIVNSTDIGILVDAYGTQPPADSRADLNKDGIVNIVDIGIVIDNYGN